MGKDIIDNYFKEYSGYYGSETIKYARNLARNIDNTTNLKDVLEMNNINILTFLNELSLISDYKFKNYGDEKLAMNEIEDILNFIVFSNEVEEQIMSGNISITSLGEDGILFYKANESAISYFLDKYNIYLTEDEFDLSIIETGYLGEKEEDGEDEEDDGFNVRWN